MSAKTFNFTFEEIVQCESVEALNKKRRTFILIDQNDKKYKNYVHASHVLIYAKSQATSFRIYERKAIVLMQMRFDGYLGFPGGLLDPGETPLEALNREIKEEMGWSTEEGPVNESDHQFTHFCKEDELVLHFYAKEVSEPVISEIERLAVKAHDHDEEVLGTIRVPLYTMGDGYKGFPCFLQNNFVGNAKMQLVETLVNLNILSKENIVRCLCARPNVLT